LPVRGYARLESGRWRSLLDLSVANSDLVRQFARRADLLVLKGDVARAAEGSRARGIWRWPTGEGGWAGPSAGEWCPQPANASPLEGAFAGFPVDSFPPAIQLTEIRKPTADWIALTAQDGRRGPQWPAVFGRDDGRVREMTVAVDGLWR